MAFFVRPLTLYEEKVIRELCERYQDAPVILKRFQIILLSHQRMKSGEIGRQLDLAPTTIVHWIKRFNQIGLDCFEALLTRALQAPFNPLPDPEPLFARMLSPAETETLYQLMETYKDRPQTSKRLQAILLSSEGNSVSEIAYILYLSQKTVRLWIRQLNIHGIYVLETFGDKSWLNRQQVSVGNQ